MTTKAQKELVLANMEKELKVIVRRSIKPGLSNDERTQLNREKKSLRDAIADAKTRQASW